MEIQTKQQPVAIAPELAANAARSRDSRHARPYKEHAILGLDEGCNIHDCNGAGEELFGYARSELIGRPISMLLPDLSGLIMDGEPNSYLKFLSRIGHHFMAVDIGKRHFACELFLNFLGNPGGHFATVIVVPAEADGNERGHPRRSR